MWEGAARTAAVRRLAQLSQEARTDGGAEHVSLVSQLVLIGLVSVGDVVEDLSLDEKSGHV